jgi:hypothetical protein
MSTKKASRVHPLKKTACSFRAPQTDIVAGMAKKHPHNNAVPNWFQPLIVLTMVAGGGWCILPLPGLCKAGQTGWAVVILAATGIFLLYLAFWSCRYRGKLEQQPLNALWLVIKKWTRGGKRRIRLFLITYGNAAREPP